MLFICGGLYTEVFIGFCYIFLNSYIFARLRFIAVTRNCQGTVTCLNSKRIHSACVSCRCFACVCRYGYSLCRHARTGNCTCYNSGCLRAFHILKIHYRHRSACNGCGFWFGYVCIIFLFRFKSVIAGGNLTEAVVAVFIGLSCFAVGCYSHALNRVAVFVCYMTANNTLVCCELIFIHADVGRGGYAVTKHIL